MCGKIRDYLITLFFHWFVRKANLRKKYLEYSYVQQSSSYSIRKLEVKYKCQILQKFHQLSQFGWLVISWLQFSPNTSNLILLQIAVDFKRIISYWIVSLVGKDQLWTEWVGINVYKLFRSSNLFSQKEAVFRWWNTFVRAPYRSKQENRNSLSIFKEMCFIKIFKKTIISNCAPSNRRWCQ